WWEGLVGIGVGYGLPWLIGTLYHLIRGREGMGLGDSKMLALIGAFFGWKGVVVSLFGGSVVGSIVMAFVHVRSGKKVMDSEVPFGPFLAIAAVFYVFAEPFIEVYARLLKLSTIAGQAAEQIIAG